MSAPLRESRKGSEGEVLRLDGEILSVLLDRAYAPGSPVELSAEVGEQILSLRGKTVSVKKQPDGRFALRFRLISLRREERLLLEGLSS